MVETLHTHDVGTSLSLNAQVRADFTAETALEAVVETLVQWGLPDVVGFDRDVRWVGAASGRDFPSPNVAHVALFRRPGLHLPAAPTRPQWLCRKIQQELPI
jgi:hypothetical protein